MTSSKQNLDMKGGLPPGNRKNFISLGKQLYRLNVSGFQLIFISFIKNGVWNIQRLNFTTVLNQIKFFEWK